MQIGFMLWLLTLHLESWSIRQGKSQSGETGAAALRLPNAFDGAAREPMPRFTVLNDHDRIEILAFHLRLAPELSWCVSRASHGPNRS